MTRLVWAGLAICSLIARPLAAETDLLALTPEERAVLGDEIRNYLIESPEIITQALSAAPTQSYEDEAKADLDLIARHASALFSDDLPGFGENTTTRKIALLVGPDCPDCETATADLRTIAASLPVRVTLVENPSLIAELGIDLLPTYVFSDMFVRGLMPPHVIERYIQAR